MSASNESNTQDLNVLLFVGITLGFLGGIVAAIAWPRTEVSAIGGAEETGSTLWLVVSLFAIWAGNMLTLVGLIGHGVRMGRLASPMKG